MINEIHSSEMTENILAMWSMSHLGDFWRTWTDAVHCAPGSFITAYKLDYGEQFGHLRHIALACTTKLPQSVGLDSSRRQLENILNVGVTNAEYTESDLQYFVSSDHPAVGASYSSYKRGPKVLNGSRSNSGNKTDLEILFQGWSSTTAQPVKVDPPLKYWIRDEISYALCTNGFALCGVKAEVHQGGFFANIEGILGLECNGKA